MADDALSPAAHAPRSPEERYRLLVGLSQLLISSLDLRGVFRRAADEVRRVTGCERVSLIRVAESDQVRHGFAVEFGPTAQWVDVPRQPLADSAASWVLTHRRMRVANRLDKSRPFPEDRALFEHGYRAYVYLPLVCRERGVGVLGVATRREERIDKWDLVFLMELSGLLAAALDNAAAYEQIAELKSRLEDENSRLREEIRGGRDVPMLIGDGPAVADVRRAVARVAPTDSTVLILGETGTGKEVVARAVHARSPRRDGLFVAVNCAALAPNLLASELFGHEAGAFTGATKRRVGRFELAHGGSLFLDEIGEAPPEVQVLLLRALQERVIERVGGGEAIPVDVRVLAATNRDLSGALADGTFRPDLYYRLNVFPIRVPPLRERIEDIPALMTHSLARCARRLNRRVTAIDPRTIELAQAYPWPGNVRELENLVERAVIVCDGDTLTIDPAWLPAATVPKPAAEARSLADQERRAIVEALERAGGRIYGTGGAAAALGLKPTTLYGKMRKLGVRRR
jgi:formate hydrogenlyase transcriptional activator